MRIITLIAAVVAAGFASPATAAFTDAFNRSDGTNMGSKWTEVAGDFRLFSGRAYIPAGSVGESFMLATSFPTTHPVMTLDIANGTSNTSTSLYVRYVDSADNIQVKFADTTGDASFDHVYLLYGNTGQGWPGMTGGPADFAVTPFTWANVRVILRFNFLELTIGPVGAGPGNFPDGPETFKFARSGVPEPALGFKFGLGGGSATSFDNVVVRGPEPGSAVLALLAAPFLRRRRTR